jgi:hypothetical protein
VARREHHNGMGNKVTTGVRTPKDAENDLRDLKSEAIETKGK